MRARSKLAIAAVGAVAAVGGATGAVFAAGGGQSDQAADIAAAINKRAGTSITSADVTGAYQDLLKERLAAAVKAGDLTQAQADQMLARAKDDPLFGPGLGGPGHGPGDRGGSRAAISAPVATLLKLSEADLREKLHSGSTLAEVAKAQGVTRAALLATITTALKAADPDLTDKRAAAVAARIADSDGPPNGRHGDPGGPGPMPPLPPTP